MFQRLDFLLCSGNWTTSFRQSLDLGQPHLLDCAKPLRPFQKSLDINVSSISTIIFLALAYPLKEIATQDLSHGGSGL